MIATLVDTLDVDESYLPTDADAPVEQNEDITYAEWLEAVELLNQMSGEQL